MHWRTWLESAHNPEPSQQLQLVRAPRGAAGRLGRLRTAAWAQRPLAADGILAQRICVQGQRSLQPQIPHSNTRGQLGDIKPFTVTQVRLSYCPYVVEVTEGITQFYQGRI